MVIGSHAAPKKKNIAPIIGVIVGAIVVIAVVLFVVFGVYHGPLGKQIALGDTGITARVPKDWAEYGEDNTTYGQLWYLNDSGDKTLVPGSISITWGGSLACDVYNLSYPLYLGYEYIGSKSLGDWSVDYFGTGDEIMLACAFKDSIEILYEYCDEFTLDELLEAVK